MTTDNNVDDTDNKMDIEEDEDEEEIGKLNGGVDYNHKNLSVSTVIGLFEKMSDQVCKLFLLNSRNP